MGVTEIRPQPGPQEAYLASRAFFTLFGGARGGGKTFAADMDMHRHVGVPEYRGLVVRRLYPDMIQPGGVWKTMSKTARLIGGHVRASPAMELSWPNEATITFRNMQYDSDAERFRGSQFDRIHMEECDELTEEMFWALVETMRAGPSGIQPRIRGNLNPVTTRSHWIAKFVAPYLDEDDYPKPEMSGVVRYFKRSEANGIEWTTADDPLGMSFTFIPSKLTDNKALTSRDPQYQKNLMNLPRHKRERMLGGRWFQTLKPGRYTREMFRVIEAEPSRMRAMRYWDHAATEPTKQNPDPDWTAGMRGGVSDGTLVLSHLAYFREGPAKKRSRMRNIAEQDGDRIPIILEREPASGGKEQFYDYQTGVLRGFHVVADPATVARGQKMERAEKWLAWLEEGNVAVVRGEWNEQFFDWVEQIGNPKAKMDAIDAVSGLFAASTRGVGGGVVMSGSAGVSGAGSRGSTSRFSGGIA